MELSGIITSKLVIRESESPQPAAAVDSDFTNDEFLGHYSIQKYTFIWTLRIFSLNEDLDYCKLSVMMTDCAMRHPVNFNSFFTSQAQH